MPVAPVAFSERIEAAPLPLLELMQDLSENMVACVLEVHFPSGMEASPSREGVDGSIPLSFDRVLVPADVIFHCENRLV